MEDIVIIEDFPNYSISRDGVVMNNETGHVLKMHKDSGGYLSVKLPSLQQRLHRLLAKAFIPNPENKECVDHINRNKLDNRLENLRWATKSENCQNVSFKNGNLHRIYYVKSKDHYNVQIKPLSIQKRFKTLEEAIAFRDAHK